jgi:hypothetical protein
MIILLNFQPIAGHYEKKRNKEFLSENFSSNRCHGPYNILKVSAETKVAFSRYHNCKETVLSRKTSQNSLFFKHSISQEKIISLS